MERDQLKELRPLVATLNSDGTKHTELFQNEVLRPAIMFQHELILAVMLGNDLFTDLIRKKGTRAEFQQKINTFIGKQPELKYKLTGAVIGALTLDEYSIYQKDQRDYDKRVHQMICQRLADTLY
jgi:hypothetical protein